MQQELIISYSQLHIDNHLLQTGTVVFKKTSLLHEINIFRSILYNIAKLGYQ